MEVDLSKRLLPKFRLRNKVRKIEYEGLYLVCFKCGVYRYREEICSDGRDADGGANVMNAEANPENLESFGPWMLAAKKSRRNNKGQGKKDNRKSNTNAMAKGLQSRGKRKDVQINEKEIERMNHGDISVGGKDKVVARGRVDDNDESLNMVSVGSGSKGPNQAAVEFEHTVVVGS